MKWSVFHLEAGYDEEIPSVVSLIPSAYLGEGEAVDMFGIDIQDISRGNHSG